MALAKVNIFSTWQGANYACLEEDKNTEEEKIKKKNGRKCK